MANQSTFGGVQNVSRDPSGLLQLADVLKRDVTPALNEYTAYKGEKITEETTAEAELKAASTEAIAYRDAVASGELDAEHSKYWIATYNNKKGTVYGNTVAMQKSAAYESWLKEKRTEDVNYADSGDDYRQFSSNFDAEVFAKIPSEDRHFLKGVSTTLKQLDNNLFQKHLAGESVQRKEISKNLSSAILLADLNNPDLDINDIIAAAFRLESATGQYTHKEIKDLIIIPTVNNYFQTEIAKQNTEEFDGDALLKSWEGVRAWNSDGATLFTAESAKNWEEQGKLIRETIENHNNYMSAQEILFETETKIKKEAKDIFQSHFNSKLGIYQNTNEANAQINKMEIAHGDAITAWAERANINVNLRADRLKLEAASRQLALNIKGYYVNSPDAGALTGAQFLELRGKGMYGKQENDFTKYIEAYPGAAKMLSEESLKAATSNAEKYNIGHFIDILDYYGMDHTDANISEVYRMEYARFSVNKGSNTTIDPDAIDPDAIDPDAIDPDAIDPDAIDPDAIDPDEVTLATIEEQIAALSEGDKRVLDNQIQAYKNAVNQFGQEYANKNNSLTELQIAYLDSIGGTN
jgi:hypothetical protein